MTVVLRPFLMESVGEKEGKIESWRKRERQTERTKERECVSSSVCLCIYLQMYLYLCVFMREKVFFFIFHCISLSLSFNMQKFKYLFFTQSTQQSPIAMTKCNLYIFWLLEHGIQCHSCLRISYQLLEFKMRYDFSKTNIVLKERTSFKETIHKYSFLRECLLCACAGGLLLCSECMLIWQLIKSGRGLDNGTSNTLPRTVATYWPWEK